MDKTTSAPATSVAAPTSTPEEVQKKALDQFKAIKIIKKGTMGTVFLVYKVDDPRCPLALKIVKKSEKFTKFDLERRARWEIQVLKLLKHPFLPTHLHTIDTKDLLGWALPYYPGGDFKSLLYGPQVNGDLPYYPGGDFKSLLDGQDNKKISNLTQIRFYVAEIVSALEYLHGKQIVYRDLKPENILLQETGHLALIDFELSQELKAKISRPLPIKFTNTNNNCCGGFGVAISPCIRRGSTTNLYKGVVEAYTFVGTEQYIAPEVIRGDGYGFGIDWWALGVLTYEMLYGTPPFDGSDRQEKFYSVLHKTLYCIDVPDAEALINLIKALLEKDPTKRLGCEGGAKDIKQHKFFQGLNWDMLPHTSSPFKYPRHDDSSLKTEVDKTKFLIQDHFGIKVDEKDRKLEKASSKVGERPISTAK